ncbi:PREDICTED: DEAD-box ATP-dependent RNA helicase 42 isoform X1 [Camelina sativa]|uniref:RNA helicase n=1 Tax=Camelina sativa TaxID=90675 RepID=A0ABM0WWX7_CAMSA|nr:PREDICTED: DEAD-box ATP-dependent RNA helicase 42 isoform X2 [Camelina sativa]XP_019095034.1 PREDICTED: DEAD-box ATP-dependent RNA helicase 42 isoform X1 [Camelina sativa]
MEVEKSKYRSEDMDVEEEDDLKMNRRDRDRSKERKKDKGSEKSREKDRRKRRSERVKSSDSEDDYGRDDDDDEEREKRKEKERERRRRDKERAKRRSERRKSSDSDEDDEEDDERDNKRRSKERERGHREHERDRGKDRKRDRDREREERKEKEREREKDRERREREREEREKERVKERERREREDVERDRREREKERGSRRNRERERSREVGNEESDDDVKRDLKRRRRDSGERKEKEREKSVGRSSRHADGNGDSPRRKSVEEDGEKKEKKTREEELEDEQKKLDEEVEKRRRRVQEWQELKRKKEEAESDSKGDADGEEPKAGKAWTLEGESDDEEGHPDEKSETEMDVDGDTNPENGGDAKMVDLENETATTVPESGGDGAADEEEIDPLDAFMNTMVLPEVEKLSNSAPPPPVNDGILDSKMNGKESGDQPKRGFNKALGRIIQGEDSDSDYSEPKDDDDPSLDEDDEEFMKRVKKTKAEKLSLVDHSKIEYEPFRKNFYIEVKDISRMTQEEVNAYRKELELKVHGKDVPRPIKSWHQTGLTTKILDTMKKLNYEKPMPIQTQALPIIMSGRDCIGVAKTGSGKTLGFVLPMLRHIKDQPPVEAGEGPIGLVMAPTRELVQQIHSDIRKFSKPLGIRCVPVYGGSGVAQQISELKRGTEIVVCTPGRMIDILCTSSGKITNLRRVTFLVMDEADRMFDMGFEPQITRIIQNIRPERQTVLFSATFPRQVETLARKVLNKPVEIQVGGRSVVNKDIAQLVEVRPESDRFFRLLELLGEWYEKGKILIFVQSQEKCDALFKDMIRQGYPCLSLHGGKDQTDRESTISDFKSNVCNLLIATSVAARGLDVKELELVVNFDAPNHYEDYVHRVGRTGRAGRKGCAVTFISEDDAKYAPDLVKALELSEQPVPADLKAIADGFMAKVKQGIEQAHGTGYGGSGFKFNEEEEEVRKAAKKAQAKEYGFEEDKSDSEDENDVVRKAGGGEISQQQATFAQIAAIAAAARAAIPVTAPVTANQLLSNGGGLHAVPGVLPLNNVSGHPSDGAGRAAAMVAAMNLQHNLAKIQADAMPEHYEAELEINDFPQNARWKVTHKETLGPISEWTGAAITTRGQFYPQGRIPGPGERKLYLFIEGPSEKSVKTAKVELKRVLEDITNQAMSLPGGAQPGKYSVI